MARYWKDHIWEYLLCVVAASALLFNTAQGFYIPDGMADSVLLALMACAALLLALFFGGYNKLTLALVPCAVFVVTVLAFLLMRSRGVDIVDAEGSNTARYIYWFAMAVICLAVYLLSRFRAGVALLFLLGSGTCGVMQFLEYDVSVWAGALFPVCCVVLFVLRQYRAQAMKSSTGCPDFRRGFIAGLVMAAAAALVSGSVFWTVIRPLNPPVMELKFLERYLAFNILEHTGISDYYSVISMEEFTDEADDTREDNDEPDDGETPSEQQDEIPFADAEAPGDEDKIPPSEGITALSSVSYTATPFAWVILALCLGVLALALPPFLRVKLRAYQMKRMAALEPKEQIKALYRFYLRRFSRLGWAKRENETPLEFAERGGQALERYLAGTCGLAVLTEAFVQARYGAEGPPETLCAACREIYAPFLKNCRELLGAARYAMKFYVL